MLFAGKKKAMCPMYGKWALLGGSDGVGVLVVLTIDIFHNLLVGSLHPWSTVCPLYLT